MSAAPDLRTEAAAVAYLVEALRVAGDDTDEDTVAIVAESETSLHEALERAVLRLDEMEAAEQAMAALIERYQARKQLWRARAERLRDEMQAAMETAGLRTARLPGATLMLTTRKPALKVMDEAQVPAKFFQKVESYKLDRALLTQAVKAGEPVPGACLDNGKTIIAIRRS